MNRPIVKSQSSLVLELFITLSAAHFGDAVYLPDVRIQVTKLGKCRRALVTHEGLLLHVFVHVSAHLASGDRS